jgi:hypothetical protein
MRAAVRGHRQNHRTLLAPDVRTWIFATGRSKMTLTRHIGIQTRIIG